MTTFSCNFFRVAAGISNSSQLSFHYSRELKFSSVQFSAIISGNLQFCLQLVLQQQQPSEMLPVFYTWCQM